MRHISEKSTERYEGGIHEHGNDVELNCCFACVLASALKSKAAMWEQASPIPAIHVQWAQSICIATQAFNGRVAVNVLLIPSAKIFWSYLNPRNDNITYPSIHKNYGHPCFCRPTWVQKLGVRIK